MATDLDFARTIEAGPIASTMEELRRKKGPKTEINQAMGRTMAEELGKRGRLIRDANSPLCAWLSQAGTWCFTIRRKPDDESARLLSAVGVGEYDSEGRDVWGWLRRIAYETGEVCELHRASYYDPENQVWAHRKGPDVLRMSPGGPTWHRRGDEGVPVFIDSATAGLEVDLDRPDDSAWSVILDSAEWDSEGAASAEAVRWAVEKWVESWWLAYSWLPNRPILCFTGEKGSGKTMLARVIGRLLSGPKWDLSSPPSRHYDWISMTSTAPILGLDNLERESKDLGDWLCRAATGAIDSIRPLYQDPDTVIQLRQISWIMTTSRTVPFARPDVAQRCLVVPLKPRKVYRPEQEIFARLSEARAHILGAFAHRACAALGRLKGARSKDYETPFRLADWARLVTMAMATDDDAGRMGMILGELAREQERLGQANDAIADVIRAIAEDGGYSEVSTGKLSKLFREKAEELKIQMWKIPASSVSLGKQLKSSLTGYEALGLRARYSPSAHAWRWMILHQEETTEGAGNEDAAW